MAVTITGIGPTALRTFTFPDANAKILTNAAAVLVSEGGTGAASLAAHGVVVGEGTSAVAVVGPDATVGKPLLSAGASADPAFGDLGVTHGGTGVTSFAAHAVVIGNGAGALTATSAGTAGQALRSGGASADPSFGEIVQTTTSTGTVNDFALTAGAGVLRCNNASLLTLTGIAAGFDGQRLTIVSVGAGQVDLSHQDAGSTTAGDRFINFATSGKTSLAPGVGYAEVVYDATTARWRLVNHEQGAWITRTFAAGNYTASAGTWTVASATRDAFYLKGRTLMVSANAGGAVSVTPVTVKIAIPNGYVSAAVDTAAYYLQQNGAGGSEGGYVTVGAAGTTVNFQRFANTAFATGTVTVNTVITFEVQ